MKKAAYVLKSKHILVAPERFLVEYLPGWTGLPNMPNMTKERSIAFEEIGKKTREEDMYEPLVRFTN